MGMDVHGLNPKQNKNINEFPVYAKYKKMEFKKRLDILDTDEKLQITYWVEEDEFNDANKGG